jgi:hypothetical protein
MVSGKMTQIVVHLPDSIRKRAEQLAASDGITVDQFFATALAEKIAVLDAANYISRRAARGNEQALLEVLAKVPAGEPEESWDKLPLV